MFKTKLKLRIIIHNLFQFPKCRNICSDIGRAKLNKSYCGKQHSGSDNTGGSGGSGKSTEFSSDNNSSGTTMYDCRKYGHKLPCDSVTPNFETLPNIPTGIFRCTAGEILGRGANKCTLYQNPEYFSFHHMTFYDMHMLLRPFRQRCAQTGRKK